MTDEERLKDKMRRFAGMYGVSGYGSDGPLARAGTPTGRASYSTPVAQHMIQSASTRKTIAEIEKMMVEEFDLAVNGDEVTVPATDFAALEARIMAIMKGDK